MSFVLICNSPHFTTVIKIMHDESAVESVFFVLILSPYRVAACSNCLRISLMYSNVWATIVASSANSSV